MPQETITITTADGACPATIFTPAGAGPWPGVIFYMDGVGIRPVMSDMAARLADAGYVVLLPDLYYRSGPYQPMDPAKLFTDPEARAELMKKVGSLTRARKNTDTEAFLHALSARPDVQGQKFGATGYCMGGNCALTAAGAFPDKFAAVASFHGGNLATDSPDSPHQFAKAITARVYVAGAIEDASFPDEQKATLEAALTEAGVEHLIETYDGAKHGFAVPDLPVHDAAAAERHWTALLTLFKETLPS
jgi:carboxymethylenebutenolidase